MPNAVRIPTSTPGAKQSTKEIHDLRGAFDTLQKQGAKGIAIGAGAAVTAKALGAVEGALGAVGDQYHLATEAASDLNESTSKSRVVFGDASRTVEQFGDDAADALGLSKRSAIEAAASFGNIFTGLDIGKDKAAQMSTTLVGLAGDLASFNNLDPTETLDKLRSGLAGEAEPLRSVGVFLSEAKVKAKAMELGLADAHGELSEGEKVLARYQLILDETSTAQGDFARTADGLANSQRTANAELENARASLGQQLLPIELQLTRAQVDLATGANALGNAFDSQGQSQDDLLGGLKALMHLFGPAGLQHALDGEIDKAIDAAKYETMHGDALAGVRSSSIAAVGPTHDLRKAFDDLSDEAADLRQLDSAVGDLASTLEDQLFGDAIRAGREADLKGQLHDLMDELDKAHAGSRKATELQGSIAEVRQELFDLHLEEAKGDGPQAVIDFLKREKHNAGNASGAIQTLIDKYMALYRVQQKIGPVIGGIRFTGVGGSLPGHAAGGRYAPNQPFMAGEKGPEIIDPGGTGGNVIPNDRLGAWGGGSTNLTINVNGVASLTPGAAEELANRLGPIITRWQQRRGMTATRGAF